MRICLFVLTTLCACTPADVVAKVGKRTVTRGDVRAAVAQGSEKDQTKVLEALIIREALANAAVERGLAARPEIRARIEALEREVLAQALLDDEVAKLGDEALLKAYDRERSRFTRRSVHAAQIFFALPQGANAEQVSEAQSKATQAWARVLGGDEFAAVARESSEDPTKARGGDLGVLVEGQVDQGLFDQVAALAPGKVSQPWRSAFGLHVFKQLEAVTTHVRTFDEVKAQLQADTVSASAARLGTTVTATTRVVRYPEHLVEERR